MLSKFFKFCVLRKNNSTPRTIKIFFNNDHNNYNLFNNLFSCNNIFSQKIKKDIKNFRLSTKNCKINFRWIKS